VGLVLEFGDRLVDFIRSQHLAAGGVDLEDDRLHIAVMFRHFQLILDVLHHVHARAINLPAGNDTIHLDHRDFIIRIGGGEDTSSRFRIAIRRPGGCGRTPREKPAKLREDLPRKAQENHGQDFPNHAGARRGGMDNGGGGGGGVG
jgi:hypothetical protein